MTFKVSDKKLLERYTKKWKKMSRFFGNKIDSETAHGDSDKYIKTK